MTIELVNPTDPDYKSLNSSFGRSGHMRLNYKALAKQYNGAAEGAIILVEFPNNARLQNIVKTLSSWGLMRNADYSIRRMIENADGEPIDAVCQVIAIKKVSDTQMKRTK